MAGQWRCPALVAGQSPGVADTTSVSCLVGTQLDHGVRRRQRCEVETCASLSCNVLR